LEQAFAARQARVLDLVADYREFVPARLAADERLAAVLAYHALVGDAPPAPARRPGAARRWLGARLVGLGARLGGARVPVHGPAPAPHHGATVGG
jgi:hypothetical protein